MIKKWQITNKIEKDFTQRFPEINLVTLQLLFNRGITTQEKIDEFFNPDYSKDIHDPFLFSDMQKVVDRIKVAIEKKEKVAVFGDYDADGVSATVVLVKTLELYGLSVEVYIPHRDKEGYGLNKGALEYLKERQVKLILTVDTGITNVEQVEIANKLGMEVIITDHHEIEDELPKAFAIIHARLPNSKYPFGLLAGVGVAFKVAQAMLQSDLEPAIEVDKASFEKWLLDLVAIGTVADIVPLVGENRTLVKYGLVVLNKTKNLGLKELIDVCRFRNGNLDSTSIAFRIAPRINAAGRMDHANTAYELLMTKSAEEASALAKRLESSNQLRQKNVGKMMNDAKSLIKKVPEKDKLVVVYKEGWSKGLAGLLAGKIMDLVSRPVIVMGEQGGNVYGSGRSVPGFNMIEAIQKLDDLFVNSGGHPMAVGFTLKDKDKLKEFESKIKKLAETELKDKDPAPANPIDAEVDLKDVDWALLEDLEKLEPFGEANPLPRFLCNNLDVVSMEKVGMDGKHVRLTVDHKGEKASKIIGFGFAKDCANMHVGDKIDVVFEVGVNEWNGSRELQLKMVDIQTTG